MGNQVIRQPDGRFGIFSSIVDGWVLVDADEDDVVAWFAERAAKDTAAAALDLVQRVKRGEKAYYQFTLTHAQAEERSLEHGHEPWNADRPPVPVNAVCPGPAACHLRDGMAVRSLRDAARGVVRRAHLREEDWTGNLGPAGIGDAVIELGPGLTRVTNMHGEWELVPAAEQTHRERVLSASITWEPTGSGADDFEPDEYPFHLVRALLTSAEQNTDGYGVFGDFGDRPTSMQELVLAVADCLDSREVPWRT